MIPSYAQDTWHATWGSQPSSGSGAIVSDNAPWPEDLQASFVVDQQLGDDTGETAHDALAEAEHLALSASVY